MQRRRFLAGAVSGAFASLLSGCGAGKYARRIAVNASVEGGGTNITDTPTEQGLVLRSYGFYRRGSSSGVRGAVANRGNVDLDFIAAYVRFFDQSGTAVGRASDYNSGFPVGETWQFNAQLLDTDPARIARYQLVVMDQRSSEVNPFEGQT
jgi:hypothetical protein